MATGGSYVRQAPFSTPGDPRHIRGAEFLKLSFDVKTIAEAVAEAEILLKHLGQEIGFVMYSWGDVVFTRKKAGLFSIGLRRRSDYPEYLSQLQASSLVRRAKMQRGEILVQLTRGAEALDATFQNLADLAP